jgi:hypothetical protein
MSSASRDRLAGEPRASLENQATQALLFSDLPSLPVPQAALFGDEDDPPRGLGFYARAFIETTIPHTMPRVHELSRKCGNYTLSLTAPAHSGLPSGVYPRRILAWMTTQALRVGSPNLPIGHLSTWAFNSLGITPTFGAKGTIPALRTQLFKLCNTSVRIMTHLPSDRLERVEAGGFQVTDYFNTVGEKAFVQLSQAFFEEICRRPVPIDLNVLKQLRSPLTTDVYVFLTYRAIRSQRLRRPDPIRWADLRDQFGCQFRHVRQFRHAFLAAIKKVLEFYPEVRLQHDEKHLTFLTYPPHVQRLSSPPPHRS